MKIRLTRFELWIIWISIITLFIGMGIYSGTFIPHFVGFPGWSIFPWMISSATAIGSIFCTWLWLSELLSETVAFKYRIHQSAGPLSVRHRASVLRPVILGMIPFWRPVKTKTVSIEMQNVFGAKWDRCWEAEESWYKIEDAQEAIENHNQQRKREVEKLFERPAKDKPNLKTYTNPVDL